MAAGILKKVSARPLSEALSAVSRVAAAFSDLARAPSSAALSRVTAARAAADARLDRAEREASLSRHALAAVRELRRAAARLAAAGSELAGLDVEPDVFVRELARALDEGLAALASTLDRPQAKRAELLLAVRARLERCGDLQRDAAGHSARSGTAAEGMKRRAVCCDLLDASAHAAASADRLLDETQAREAA